MAAKVSQKEVASIINHVLRAFTLPDANIPTKVYDPSSSTKYKFTEKSLAYSVSAGAFKPFEDRMVEVWEMIQKTKNSPYNYKWDIEKLETDHVIEVQHVVAMLFEGKYLDDFNWSTLRLGTVAYLGYYLNNQRNLWKIPKAFNQAKSWIPLSCWYGHPDPQTSNDAWKKLQHQIAQEYLFAYSTDDDKTPFMQLVDLAAEMAGLEHSPLTWLTIGAGKVLLALLESWVGKIDGIDVNQLPQIEAMYNLTKVLEPGTPGAKRQRRARARAQKGLMLFASDAKHTAMSKDQESQTDFPEPKPVFPVKRKAPEIPSEEMLDEGDDKEPTLKGSEMIEEDLSHE